MKILKTIALIPVFLGLTSAAQGQQVKQSDRLHIIIIGAHPDDPDKVGGTAYKWVKAGHDVLMVSLTNGDAGHQTYSSGELAKIRREEAKRAGEVIGVRYITLDNHDGQLMPTYENRLQVIKLIREQKADIVIFPRPYDYHPDHRYCAIAIQDAAFLVIVPNIVHETPALKRNPVFLYTEDRFNKPYPFSPDITVDITSVFDQKIHAISAHESQFFEWLPWTSGQHENVPKTAQDRLKWLAAQRKGQLTDSMKKSLQKWYGAKAEQVKYAEAFEICEYGRYPNDEEIRRLFPMLKKD